MTTLPKIVVAENTTPVSKAILALDPYEPSNVMVTGYRNVSDSSTRSPIARLSWKNPTASSLRNVSVFSVDENDSETLLTTITDPVSGAVCNYDYAQGAENSVTSSNKPSGTVNFKLLFDFTDGEKREVLYTGSWGPQVAVALGDYSVYFINNDNAALETRVTLTDELGGEQGVSFKIESNCLRADGNHRLEITDSNALTNGAKYKGTFKVKTLGTAEVGVGAKNKYVQISGSEEWQTITIDEFTASSTCYINFRGSSHELYIDDIELTAVASETAIQTYSENFNTDAINNNLSCPQNIKTMNGNERVTFIWDSVSSGSFVKIFEKKSDGSLRLRAVTLASNKWITVGNLENDSTYDFVLQTYGASSKELPSSFTETMSVTPSLPDSETQIQLDDVNEKCNELKTLLEQCDTLEIFPTYEISAYKCVRICHEQLLEEVNHGYMDNFDYYTSFIIEGYADLKPKLESYILGETSPVSVNKYVSGDVSLTDDGMIAEFEDGRHKQVYAMGFGHFLSTDSDVIESSELGFIANQCGGSMNIGPVDLLQYKDGVFSKSENADDKLNALRNSLELFRENNLIVGIGTPIHYIGSWSAEDFRTNGATYGFVNYNPTSPTAKNMLAEYFKILIPVLDEYKDVICSITYANEPNFSPAGNSYYVSEWINFLKNKYNNNLNELNNKYKATYTSFDSIPMPDSNYNIYSCTAYYYDYRCFVTDIHYRFFEFCRNEIKKHTDIACGVKLMQFVESDKLRMQMVFDYDKFAELFDFNGCDSFSLQDSKLTIPAKMAWYDLVTSLSEIPVVDSEVHVAKDGQEITRDDIKADWVGASLWMGALHDCCFSGAWLYSDGKNAIDYRNTSFRFQPDMLLNYAKQSLDSMRLNDELKAFNDKNRDVGILYSFENIMTEDANSSSYSDGFDLLFEAYEIVTGMGQRPFFVSVNQPEKLNKCKVLIVTNKNSVTDTMNSYIESFKQNGGTVIYRQDYIKKYEIFGYVISEKFDETAYSSNIKSALENSGLLDVQITASNGMKGIEWNSVNLEGRTLISACNYTNENVDVSVKIDGQICTYINDIKNMKYDLNTVTLEPFVPVLLDVSLTRPNLEIEQPYLSLNGKYVEGLMDGVYNARVRIKNNTDKPVTAVLVAAVYNDEQLESCYISDVAEFQVGKGFKDIIVKDVLLDDSVNKNYTVKLMCWSDLSTTLTPYCEAVNYYAKDE